MMYFDSKSKYSYDYGVHFPLTVSAILVYLCIMVWIHMDAHEHVFVFQNLNILCIFSDRFFDPVFFRFRFLGSTGSMTSPVLVTLVPSPLEEGVC